MMKKSKCQQYFYCLYTNFICILVQLLVEYGNYYNKRRIQRCGSYQRGGAYLNVDTQRCGAYQRKYGNKVSCFPARINDIELNGKMSSSVSQFFQSQFFIGCAMAVLVSSMYLYYPPTSFFYEDLFLTKLYLRFLQQNFEGTVMQII